MAGEFLYAVTPFVASLQVTIYLLFGSFPLYVQEGSAASIQVDMQIEAAARLKSTVSDLPALEISRNISFGPPAHISTNRQMVAFIPQIDRWWLLSIPLTDGRARRTNASAQSSLPARKSGAPSAPGHRKAARFARRATYLHGATPQAGPRDPKAGPPCA